MYLEKFKNTLTVMDMVNVFLESHVMIIPSQEDDNTR